jgi:ribosomal protein S18 acetylase RimI-like enzyme
MSPAQQSVVYGIYTKSDEDEMMQLLGQVFAERDPPAVAVGVTPAEFEELIQLFTPKAAADGLTIVARSAETGEMCGVMLTEDSASSLPDGLEHLSSKFDPIFDILGQLGEAYRSGEAVRPGESIHLFLLGVSRRFAGRGIAQQLVAECLANGISRGYRVAVTEATNKISQHVFEKQGFVERVRRSYGDYRFGGQAVFASIADQGGPMLMEKRLAGSD